MTGLTTTNSERKIWLVKVPANVAERWRDACEHSADGQTGPELGRVRLAPDGQVSKMLLSGPLMASLPIKEYQMQMHSNNDMPMHVLVEKGNTIEISGKVFRKYDLQVNEGTAGAGVSEAYSKLNKERNEKCNTKTRYLQKLDEKRQVAMAPMPGQYQALRKQALADKKAKLESGSKRVRMEKEDLENMLFKIFERQHYITFKELERQTAQPVQFLKDTLQGIALHNKKGPNKDKWELKKEYKTRGATSVNPATAG